ncbi:DUF6525 family protein [Frigidibacter oleivorans]|uniref:DUF6525 family protein n=1 Tax=Frigidibacter oleivorans TaxID=2487129 RepID=UPI000F8E174D|nr:DUF6525 family protein [Frigidibacter oleivorans]
MAGNLRTGLRRRRRSAPMAAHDRLPAPVRAWAAQAALPWSAASLWRLWHRALAETGCPDRALARLDAAEARLLARDAARVWGAAYPLAAMPKAPAGPGPARA